MQRPGDLLARMVLGERQVPRHLTQLRRPVFQFGRALLKGHRGTLAFGDVGHERECASAARRRNVIDGDFDRKHGPVLADADEVLAARGVRAVAKDRWHQALDRLADQLFGGPAEHHLDCTIRKDEHPTRVRRNDALRGGLEQRSQRAIVFLVATRLESILSPAALGDVQFESSEPRDSAVGVAIGSAQALHPCALFRPGRTITVRVLPRILGLSTSDLVQQCERSRGRSSSCTRGSHVSNDGGFVRREPESCAEGVGPSRRHWSRGSHVQEPPADASSARRSRVFCSRSAASARVRSTASQVRSATSRTSSISAAVHTRGVS